LDSPKGRDLSHNELSKVSSGAQPRSLWILLGFEQAENQILRGGFAAGGDPLKLQTRFWLVQIGE
jgi:hypothetical protein